MASKSFPLLNRALGTYGSQGLALANVTTRLPIATPHTLLTQYKSPACLTHPLRTANTLQLQRSSISTTAPKSVVGWIQDKLANRAKTKKEEKLIDQISLMANTETWTLKMFADEIDETLSQWATKLPGLSNTTEIATAKETQKIVKAMTEHLGSNITGQDLAKMDRKKKLKLAIACEKPVDELNSVLNSFRQMEVMHRILRHRKANGMILPTDEVGLKQAMQEDGMKVMTGAEKREMKDAYAKFKSGN